MLLVFKSTIYDLEDPLRAQCHNLYKYSRMLIPPQPLDRQPRARTLEDTLTCGGWTGLNTLTPLGLGKGGCARLEAEIARTIVHLLYHTLFPLPIPAEPNVLAG
jgi:hypothetical protein